MRPHISTIYVYVPFTIFEYNAHLLIICELLWAYLLKWPIQSEHFWPWSSKPIIIGSNTIKKFQKVQKFF